MLAARTPATRVVDLAGACVTPGLVDAHQHPFWGARAMRGADLTGAADLAAVRALLAAEARRAGPGGWVLGHGLRRRMFPDGAVRGDVLADATGGAPVFATFVDGHSALASPEALRRAEVTGPRPFPDGSEIVCADGAPTGELREPSAMDAVRAAIPGLGDRERRDLYAAVLDRMAAAGLTGVHVMDSDPNIIDDLEALEATGRLPLRVVLALWRKPGMGLDEMRDDLRLARRAGRRWRVGAAKFFLDGVVPSGTAWLSEPDLRGRTGGPFWPEVAHYDAAVALHAAAGVGCVTHAIGDRAVRHALDVYAANPPRRAPGDVYVARHRLEHAEILDPADTGRFAALDVVASTQPIHLSGVGALAGVLGEERAAAAWPVARLARAGAVVALGSDWPVAPFPPLLGMAWARLRRAPGSGDAPHAPEERLSAIDALRGHTEGAAYAVGEETVAGRVAPGMRADLTILAEDPRAVDPDRLPEVAVLGTVVDGRMEHDPPRP